MRRRAILLLSVMVSAAMNGCHEEPLSTGPVPTAPRGDPAHSLRVKAPNGGETYRVGDTLGIELTQAPGDYYVVEVSMSLDSGRKWFPLTGDRSGALILAQTSSLSIVLAETLSVLGIVEGELREVKVSTVSDRCLISAVDYDDRTVRDTSDAVFSIVK